MVGVFSRQWVEPLAQVLKNLGSERVWVVHGSDGLDEITTAGADHVAALENGTVRTFEIAPEEVGLARVKPESCAAATPEANAQALRDVLEGEHGAYRDVALLNAGGRPGGRRQGQDAQARACSWPRKAVDSGEAEGRLDRLIAVSKR